MAENLLELFETGSGSQVYGTEVGHILSVVSVDASEIGRGFVVQSGDWSTGKTGVGREKRDLSVDESGI